MPNYNEKDFYFRTSVGAEKTCRRSKKNHGNGLFVSFETGLTSLSNTEISRKGREGEKAGESNKGQCKLMKEWRKLAFKVKDL